MQQRQAPQQWSQPAPLHNSQQQLLLLQMCQRLTCRVLLCPSAPLWLPPQLNHLLYQWWIQWQHQLVHH